MAGVPEQGVFNFPGDPDRPDQKINQALKKRRLVPLDEMPQEQQDPSGEKKRQADSPYREARQNDSHKNDWNPDSVKELVPRIRMLVVILRHVLLKCRHRATSVVIAYTYTPPTRKNQDKQNASYLNCLAHFSTKAMLASL
jgi:hypothetical protein